MTRKPLPRDEVLRRKSEMEQYGLRNQVAGEERHVKFLLTRFGLIKKKWTMLKTAEARLGQRRLSLDLFNEMCPTFPLLLAYSYDAGHRLHRHADATLPAFYTRFHTAPFLPAYEDWFERAEPEANGRAIGLLFPYDGIKPGLVLPKRGGLEGLGQRGMVSVYHAGSREQPYCLYLQAFAQLVEAIYKKGHGWKAEQTAF